MQGVWPVLWSHRHTYTDGFGGLGPQLRVTQPYQSSLAGSPMMSGAPGDAVPVTSNCGSFSSPVRSKNSTVTRAPETQFNFLWLFLFIEEDAALHGWQETEELPCPPAPV
jgi:hypothetical protein